MCVCMRGRERERERKKERPRKGSAWCSSPANRALSADPPPLSHRPRNGAIGERQTCWGRGEVGDAMPILLSGRCGAYLVYSGCRVVGLLEWCGAVHVRVCMWRVWVGTLGLFISSSFSSVSARALWGSGRSRAIPWPAGRNHRLIRRRNRAALCPTDSPLARRRAYRNPPDRKNHPDECVFLCVRVKWQRGR